MELRLAGIKKSFDEKEVLKGLDFSFEKGKIYGLLGRNGAGKTTLFNILADEIKAEEGRAFLATAGEERDISPKDLSYVYSTPVLPDFLTGYEFIRFFIDLHKKDIENLQSIDAYFDLIQFEKEDRHRLMKGYSHGMKNKIQMLLFLIAKPTVILLDEPLTSLDVVVALEMKKLLKSIREDHIIIFSTHILQLAADLCDEIAILHEGKMSLLDHDKLGDESFEEEIIRLLKEENHGE